jgi:hypothetical protein
VFSTNPPERLWGIMAAGPYGLAALAALLAGRRGRRIAVAVSLAGAVIVPLAWMAWTGRAQPEVGVVIHSAGLFLHDGTPYQAAHAVATAHNPYVYNPYLPALAVFITAPSSAAACSPIRGCGSGGVHTGFAGTLARAVCRGPGCGRRYHRLADHRVSLTTAVTTCVLADLYRPGPCWDRPGPAERSGTAEPVLRIAVGLVLGLAAAMRPTVARAGSRPWPGGDA